MTVQTMRGTQARLRVSRTGAGLDHYHLIVSTTTGLNGATVARAYETLQPAQIKALAVREAYVAEGYTARERQNGAILELTKTGADTGLTTRRYLFVRPCSLRHSR